jgi:hypothetical protein
MTDRPMLFSGAMIRAIIAGRKSQTRRAISFPGSEKVIDFVKVATDKAGRGVYEMKDKYGTAVSRPAGKGIVDYHFTAPIAVGDRLWAREEFSGPHRFKPKVNPPATWPVGTDVWYWADGNPDFGDWTRPKPAMHMPRWMSRITLFVTDVRIQRLRSISEIDAIAEGAELDPISSSMVTGGPMIRVGPGVYLSPVAWYHRLWDEINGKGAWEKNPWVIAYTFAWDVRNIDDDQSANGFYGSLDDGVPNHFDHSKRGFQP